MMTIVWSERVRFGINSTCKVIIRVKLSFIGINKLLDQVCSSVDFVIHECRVHWPIHIFREGSIVHSQIGRNKKFKKRRFRRIGTRIVNV